MCVCVRTRECVCKAASVGSGGPPLPRGLEPGEGAHWETRCVGTGDVGLGSARSPLFLVNRL